MGQNIAKVVFQPPTPSYSKDPNLVWLNTHNHEVIPAFFLPSPSARFTLLFSHGNAEDLGLIVSFFRKLSRDLRVNVFSYEYTGYGMSTGQPQESNVYADIEAAFVYLRDTKEIPWEKIVPYGRSIGTCPSVHLSSRTAVRGVILQSPLVSIYRIAFNLRFTLPGDLFTNINKVKDICAPVFIIHGTRDEIVPVWHGQDMYEACVAKGIAYDPYWVEGADHNTLEEYAGDEFVQRFTKFLDYLEQTPISKELRQQAENSQL